MNQVGKTVYLNAMSFIAFKVSDYDHTAEREQYRAICNMLKSKYETSDDLCIFIANYNIFDCEFDGLVIKSDALISIEFKNFGGSITAVENGHWKLADGTIIKGGSNKSVYQQARVNHVALKNGLKEGGILPTKMLSDIPSLIVFAQPISLTNNLGARTRSWLHICDNDHFIEKIEDITSSKFFLSNEQIMELLPKLGLLDEFVDARFTVDINLTPRQAPEISNETPVESAAPSATMAIETRESQIAQSNNEGDAIKDSYQTFIKKEVLPVLNITESHSLLVVHYSDYERIMGLPLPFKSEYIAILQIANAKLYANTLERLFHKDVVTLSDKALVWGEGEFVTNRYVQGTKVFEYQLSPSPTKTIRSEISGSANSFILPIWLDKYIFQSLGGKYKPAHERFSYNLDLDKAEAKIYLGTYFPRSFAESLLVFDTLLQSENLRSIIVAKKRLNILDFGCGSGGEIFGMLEALEKSLSIPLSIRIVGIDGNQNSLRIFEKIIAEYMVHGRHKVELVVAPCFIESSEDFLAVSELIGNNFDFIITSKAIGELERKKRMDVNGYEFFASIFAPLLTNLGIMVILDVTIKDESTGLFLPQVMNKGVNAFLAKATPRYQSLAPCSGGTNIGQCSRNCFYKKEIFISHSSKSKDISKFALRIIARKELQVDKEIFNNILQNAECSFK